MILNKIKKYIFYKIVKFEGGEKYSKSLRKKCKNKYNVDVGLYTYGSCFSPGFNIGGKVTIGKYCSFAGNIKYFGGNHPMHYVSMSPFFYNEKWGGFTVKDIDRKSLEVGNDVWVGANVIITSKCEKIGNGAVIGAGSIVTKDVPPYSVVVGNPARVIKYRFSEEVIKKIEESKWWELTPDELIEFQNLIDKPLEFCDKVIAKRKSK